jgi:hypothetical protein
VPRFFGFVAFEVPICPALTVRSVCPSRRRATNISSVGLSAHQNSSKDYLGALREGVSSGSKRGLILFGSGRETTIVLVVFKSDEIQG